MRSCCSSQKKNPFSVVILKNSKTPSSVRNPWMKCCGWWLWISGKTPCSRNRTLCLWSYWAVDSSKYELFQIQFLNVMSCQWRLLCLEFQLLKSLMIFLAGVWGEVYHGRILRSWSSSKKLNSFALAQYD